MLKRTLRINTDFYHLSQHKVIIHNGSLRRGPLCILNVEPFPSKTENIFYFYHSVARKNVSNVGELFFNGCIAY